MTQDDPRIAAAAPFLHGLWQRGLNNGAPPDDVDIRDLLRRLDAVPAPEGEAVGYVQTGKRMGKSRLVARRAAHVLGLYIEGPDAGVSLRTAESALVVLRDFITPAPASPAAEGAGERRLRPDFDIDCDAVPSLGIPEGIAHGWEFKSGAFYPSDSVQAFAGVVLLVSSDGTQEFKVDEPEIVALEQDAERVLAAITQVRAWDDPPPAPAGPSAEGAGETDDLAHVRVGDDDPTPDDGGCPARDQLWRCTREVGHPGQHIAGDGSQGVRHVWTGVACSSCGETAGGAS